MTDKYRKVIVNEWRCSRWLRHASGMATKRVLHLAGFPHFRLLSINVARATVPDDLLEEARRNGGLACVVELDGHQFTVWIELEEVADVTLTYHL